jgi:hypothetical protein
LPTREQQTNADAVLPESQWRGYRPPAEPPAPAAAGDLRAVVQILGADPKDRLTAALARLGRAFMARDS